MTALLVIIYLSFVGLGLPNSVLGSIWPQMQMELGADVSLVGYLSMTVTAGTVASSVLADRIVCRLGVARVTVISVLMTAGALLGFALSPGVEGLFLCALPMGLAAGAADVALNNFVALHYEAKHMSWLHCFWGIGASIGPMLVAVSLRTGASWRTGYGLISAVVCALCVILICTLPLWGRASGGAGGHQRAAPICVGHIFRRRDVLPLLCGHFCSRLPDEDFLIFDAAHGTALLRQSGHVQYLAMEHYEPARDVDELNWQALWKRFFHALTIEERRNAKAQMNHAPKRFWGDMVEMREPYI